MFPAGLEPLHYGNGSKYTPVNKEPVCQNTSYYYPSLLRRVEISRETSTNITRYLYSSHSSRPREVQNLGKSEFWEKKSLDNKSLIRRFGV